jgi:MFS family permease
LWSASVLSNLADGVFQVALPLLALRITRSPGAIAGLALTARLPWLFFALPAGALADRLDRRRTMVRVGAARAVLLAALAAATAAGHEELWILYLVAFGLGVGETLFDTAAQSVMPMVVGPDRLSAANGRLFAAEMTMNQFVGPPLGGLIAGTAVALAFAGSAGAYLAAALLLAAMPGRFRPERTGGRPPRLRADIAEGVRYLFGHRLLRTLALMTGLMNLMSSAAFAVFPLYAVKPGPLGLSDAGYGLFLTAMAVGALGGSLLAARIERRLGRARSLMAAVVASGLLLAGPALFTTAGPTAALLVGGGFGTVIWNVVTVSLRQRIVPEPFMGRVNAGYRLLAWGTMPVGAALGGGLAEAFGVRSVFVVAALAQLALLLASRAITDRAIAEAEERRPPVDP